MNNVINKIIDYRNRMGWQENDTLDSLAKSIIIEAAELLENFQWASKKPDMENVKEELADILMYTLTMVNDLGLNVEEIIDEKIQKNSKKYPENKK